MFLKGRIKQFYGVALIEDDFEEENTFYFKEKNYHLIHK